MHGTTIKNNTHNVHTGKDVVVLYYGFVDITPPVLRYVAILNRTEIWIFDAVRKASLKNVVTSEGNSSGDCV
jgi:hypothetical protein